jgi:hypothetical protein
VLAGLNADGNGGLGDGSSGDGTGGADGDGSAGDGEVINLKVNFTTLRGTWTVAASAYGIQGQSGVFTLARDTVNGGYRFLHSGSVAQNNLRVSRSGYITGSVPLRINGREQQSKFIVPVNRVGGGTLASAAGLYNVVWVSQAPGLNGSFNTVGGGMNLAADGAVRICPFAAFSATCPSALTGSFTPVAGRTAQFVVSLGGVTEGTATLVTSASNKSFAWDFIRRSGSAVSATGTRVAVSQTANYDARPLGGTWDVISHLAAFSGSVGSTTFTVAPSTITQVVSIEPSSDGSQFTVRERNVVSGFCGTSSPTLRISALPGTFGTLLQTGQTPLSASSVGDILLVQQPTDTTTTLVLVPVSSDLMVNIYAGQNSAGSLTGGGVSTGGNSNLGSSAGSSFGYSYFRRMRATASTCEQLGAGTIVGGSVTLVINGQTVTPGGQLAAQIDALGGTPIALFPGLELAPPLCATMDRMYNPSSSSGAYNWSRCGDNSGNNPVSLGSFSLISGKMPYNASGASVPLSQGCLLTSPGTLSNVLTLVSNGQIYSAAMDGEAGDKLSFSVGGPIQPATNSVIEVSQAASGNTPATTIRLEQSPAGFEVRRASVIRGGTTVVSCFNPNAF